MSHSHRVPSYRKHKQSGQAVVTLTDGIGGRRDVLLGKYGTAGSRAEYARVVAEWEAAGHRFKVPGGETGSLSINEVMLAFIRHAEQHYRHEDGTPTSELREFKAALKPLKEIYGGQAVADFGPLKLKAVRQKLVDAGLSRGVVNQRTGRIVRMFKWAVSEELAPEGVWRSLTTVPGLGKGRTEAHETQPVKPVAEAVVKATLPFMPAPVRGMVELQLLTGMRPGEVRIMRACDLDITGAVWLFRPAHHKTTYRGKERVVALGPRHREIVKSFLKLDTQAYLFSPRDAAEARRRPLREHRKTPVQPSQQDRRKRRPRKGPGELYEMTAYHHAVKKAIEAANTAQACAPCKAPAPDKRCAKCKAAAIPHWHPHMLRHTHATEVRRRFGLEAAQVALGHSQAAVTELYAERNMGLAMKVAAEIG